MQISLSIVYETVKSLREKKKKSMILDQLLLLLNSRNFRKFSNNRFWWLLKQMFLNSYQHIRSYNALLLKLRYYKTSSKHAVAMPLHKAYFLTWIYRQLSFIAWKWVDRELYGPKKSPISRDYWQLFLLLCATCLVYY